ncbi:hypothetical protein [Protaetiibacter larvae]|uniref:hypothetical protein n=1 Tax=Protaetiibacter larvae TaxID=2592654 RepID=UPI00143D0E45|nr:hypothetical protein [Protaetiibacter larvae]
MEEPTTTGIWTAFGSIVTDITAAIPQAIETFWPVLGALAVLGIGLGIARKFGVRR